MPQITQTLAAGVNFDGTAGNGLIDFPAASPTKAGDDTQRVNVITASIAIGQVSGNARLRDVVIAFGPSLDAVKDDGNGYLFVADSDVHQFVVPLGLVLPPHWLGFVFATEASGTFIKTMVLDYNRVTLAPVAGGTT